MDNLTPQPEGITAKKTGLVLVGLIIGYILSPISPLFWRYFDFLVLPVWPSWYEYPPELVPVVPPVIFSFLILIFTWKRSRLFSYALIISTTIFLVWDFLTGIVINTP